MTNATSPDQRKAVRINAKLPVWYGYLFGPSLKTLPLTINVSGTGAAIPTPKRLPNGKRIRTKIHFPQDPKPVSLISEVVWSKPQESGSGFITGIKHLHIAPADRERFVFLYCETMLENAPTERSHAARA